MKPTILIVLILLSASMIKAQDRFSWLRESPVKKPTAYSSSQGKVSHNSLPEAAWTVSNKGTITITNKRPAKPKGTSPAPALSTKKTAEKEKSAKAARNATAQTNPAEIPPDQLDNYIAELETELNKLNSEAQASDTKNNDPNPQVTVNRLRSNAEQTLQSSSKKYLQSEFMEKGASMSDAEADRYLEKLLKTLQAQN